MEGGGVSMWGNFLVGGFTKGLSNVRGRSQDFERVGGGGGGNDHNYITIIILSLCNG